MLHILFFVLHRRFVNYFSNTGSVLSLFLKMLYLLSLLLCAVGLGWLIDAIDTVDDYPINSKTFISIINAMLCALYAIINFFPTYKQRSSLVPSIFPIKFSHRWILNMLYDLFTFTIFGTGIAFFIINILSITYTIIHLITSLLLLANTVIFVQLIKAFFENVHRQQVLFTIIWITLSLAIAFSGLRFQEQSILLLIMLILGISSQLILLILLDRSIVEKINIKFTFEKKFPIFNQLPSVYTIFLYNTKARKGFLLGLILKTTFILFQGDFMNIIPMSGFIQMIYVAPLILFTYVANNLWGFFPAVWVNSIFGKKKDIYKIYFQILILPVLIDFLVTISATIYTKSLNSEIILFYVITAILLSINGLIFSLYKPLSVKRGFNFGQMKNNVNGRSIGAATCLVGLTMLSLGTIVSTLLLCLAITVGICFLLNRQLPHEINTKYKLYGSLFNKSE